MEFQPQTTDFVHKCRCLGSQAPADFDAVVVNADIRSIQMYAAIASRWITELQRDWLAICKTGNFSRNQKRERRRVGIDMPTLHDTQPQKELSSWMILCLGYPVYIGANFILRFPHP